jgi:small subunit ribosomal protein S4
MSRYIGPKIRIIRRLGELPGLTKKTTARKYGPGQHGPSKLTKKITLSDYSLRLQEKQKLRYNYGISETQLYKYFKEAQRLKGLTGTLILQLLEMRLENIVYRLGFASTIASARQFVTHSHVNVNGKSVNIPSFQCKPNDLISIKPRLNSKLLAKKNLENSISSILPTHLELDKENLTGKVKGLIKREEVNLVVNELLIVEFYSRK